jgi:three-Cys-motif partner protein
MSKKDHHSEPFDDGTLAKLEIFEDYANAWLPVWVMQPKVDEIHILDLFAGPGYDANGVAGSPIRILDAIKQHLGNILQSNTKIHVHFNEFQPDRVKQPKYENLVLSCDMCIALEPKFKYFLSEHYYNEDAEKLLDKLLLDLKHKPLLVYLDQNGVKLFSQTYVQKLASISRLDFLYFVSSSYFKWLGQTPEFKQVLDFKDGELLNVRQLDMHRVVVNKMRSQLAGNSKLKLYPYSIKKLSNVFGIVFGSKHPLAVDKFLSIAWRRNPLNGEAEYDIDSDAEQLQLTLFAQHKLTRLMKFRNDLTQFITSGETKTNQEVIDFTYEYGHIPTHASDLVRGLKGKTIAYSGHPCITYDSVFKNKKVVRFERIEESK